MIWRLTALVLGAVFFALVAIVALRGVAQFTTLLITVAILVVLVAGGNWMQGWLGIRRRAPQFARPDRDHDDDDADRDDGPSS